jgi:hypothetical protein
MVARTVAPRRRRRQRGKDVRSASIAASVAPADADYRRIEANTRVSHRAAASARYEDRVGHVGHSPRAPQCRALASQLRGGLSRQTAVLKHACGMRVSAA